MAEKEKLKRAEGNRKCILSLQKREIGLTKKKIQYKKKGNNAEKRGRITSIVAENRAHKPWAEERQSSDIKCCNYTTNSKVSGEEMQYETTFYSQEVLRAERAVLHPRKERKKKGKNGEWAGKIDKRFKGGVNKKSNRTVLLFSLIVLFF